MARHRAKASESRAPLSFLARAVISRAVAPLLLRRSLGSLLLLAACARDPQPIPDYPPLTDETRGGEDVGERGPIILSVVGTNDVHGHLEEFATFAGHLENLRAARAEDGAVLLIDGGDMWQGTLESNSTEGEVMVRLFNAVGYDAATIGNHEFDYGPVGLPATPTDPAQDPRGALLANVARAEFPILSANLRVATTGEPIDWAGVEPTAMLERAGVKIGVIGVTTEDTLSTTIAANFRDLQMAPIAEMVVEHATRLRGAGAEVLVLTAHAGGVCTDFSNPDDLSSCEPNHEIFAVAEALPPGTVDVIVAGHTHRGVAHNVNGFPIIEQFAYGRAFGRVDLVLDPETHAVVERRVHAPHFICGEDHREGPCEAPAYAGQAVTPNPEVAALVQRIDEELRPRRERRIGPTLGAEFARARTEESPLGNLLADLILEARQTEAQVSIMNGGGVRAPLPAGPLVYGDFYTTFPFDNRFAFVRLTGAQLRELVANNLAGDGGLFMYGGLRVQAECRAGELSLALRDARGRRIRDGQRLVVVTSDYLATTPPFAAFDVQIENGVPMREALVEILAARGEVELEPDAYADARIVAPARPVSCGSGD